MKYEPPYISVICVEIYTSTKFTSINPFSYKSLRLVALKPEHPIIAGTAVYIAVKDFR